MKSIVWNIILTTLATALLGLLGWTLLHVSRLEQAEASRSATEFKMQDAAQLQKELTKIMTDIDIRLRLIERDIQWIKGGSIDPEPAADGNGGALKSFLDIPIPDPPRYQLEEMRR